VKEGRNWLVKLMFSARGPAATKNNNQNRGATPAKLANYSQVVPFSTLISQLLHNLYDIESVSCPTLVKNLNISKYKKSIVK